MEKALEDLFQSIDVMCNVFDEDVLEDTVTYEKDTSGKNMNEVFHFEPCVEDVRLDGKTFRDSFYFGGDEITLQESAEVMQPGYKVPPFYFLKDKNGTYEPKRYYVVSEKKKTSCKKCKSVISIKGESVTCDKCGTKWIITKQGKETCISETKKTVKNSFGTGYIAVPEQCEGWSNIKGEEKTFRFR